MTGRYLEDFAVGQIFRSGRLLIDMERIKTFGAEFDPQPFHLDEEAARDTIFGGLAASGWHTAAVTMRLLVESDIKPAGGIVGAGFDEFRWTRPVRPGDELRVESEILEVRPSRRRSTRTTRPFRSPSGASWYRAAQRRKVKLKHRLMLRCGPMRSVPPRGSGWVLKWNCSPLRMNATDPPATAWWY